MPAGYLKRRGWTRGEVAIWLFALAVVILGEALLVIGIVGHWVLPVGGVIVLALGLMRSRAGNRAEDPNADDTAAT